jgi:hypothetical protein
MEYKAEHRAAQSTPVVTWPPVLRASAVASLQEIHAVACPAYHA